MGPGFEGELNGCDETDGECCPRRLAGRDDARERDVLA